MQISIFGVLLILFYIYIFLAKSSIDRFVYSLIMLLFCSLTVQMGYFVMIGEKGIPFSTIALIASTFFGLICPADEDRDKPTQLIQVSGFLVLSCFVSVVLLKIFPYTQPIIANSNYSEFLDGNVGYSVLSTDNIKYGLIAVIVFISVILYRIKLTLDEEDILYIARKFLNVSFFAVVGIGFLEFIIENMFQSLFVTDLTISIFGEYGAQQNWLIERNGIYAIQGTTKEASMYSVSLLYTAIMCLYVLKQEIANGCLGRKYSILLLLLVILLVVNRSMSSYVYVFILALCFVFVNPYSWIRFSDTRLVSRVILAIGVCILLFWGAADILMSYTDSDNYFLSRLALSLEEFSSMSSGVFNNNSEGIRYLGIYQCWKVFLDRAIFGVGFTELTCLSGFITMLVSMGVVGVFLWIRQILIFSNITLNEGSTIIFIVLILPNILLNDIGTMLSFAMPFVFLLLSMNHQKDINYDYE